jgi:anaphase-promoting complex subunit 3
MQNQPVNGQARPHSQNADAPNAPRRRLGLGAAQTQEVAHNSSRIRSLSRRRLDKSNTEEDVQDQAQQPYAAIPLKRNMSGSVASSSSNAPLDPSQGAPRRSRRLFTQLRPNSSKVSVPLPPPSIGLLNPKDALEPKKIKATGTRGRSATQSTVGRVVSGNRKPVEGGENVLKDSRIHTAAREDPPPPQVYREDNEDRRRHYGAFHWLMDLFGRLGTAYAAQSSFDNEDAIKRYNLLPAGQRDTPWVLAQLGKAYLEQSKYADSEKQFVRLRKLAPSRLEDMEIYSTVLWHLKQDNELTYLAHELMDADRLSPEAWCALGNSFSLHREHDQALKCFRRATQLNPKMSYAFTLQGHEHIANEDYEKAQQAFRRALASDARHYNAWYGLGKVHQHLGQHDAALRHYRAAASINATSSVLMYCMGLVSQHKIYARLTKSLTPTY